MKLRPISTAAVLLLLLLLASVLMASVLNKDDGISDRDVRKLVSNTLHVNHVYTYGAPSVVKGPHLSNPDNTCIPGLRIYTEDFETTTCDWWQWWCRSGVEEVTNVDFASQRNVKQGYPHPKMATLVLRLGDRGEVEYNYGPCHDFENRQQYGHQWWPNADEYSSMRSGRSIHSLDEDYERRLVELPLNIRRSALEYVSVAQCGYKSSYAEVSNCLNNYSSETSSKIGGIATRGYAPFAYMVHKSDSRWGMSDSDTIYVLKNDNDPGYRKCIISFEGSDTNTDLAIFSLGNNVATEYCGRHGVHRGVAEELMEITNDPQYSEKIKPALQTCREVTCVGHSLGGALCNLFTMCANQGVGNNDYESLIWRTPFQ